MLGAHLLQYHLALDEGPSGLHEVVDDDDVAARRGALLDAHNALVAVADLWRRDETKRGQVEVKL